MTEARRAVGRPLIDGVESRDVPTHEELHRRLSVAEHVVRRAEPRHQVLLLEWAVLSPEHHGAGQKEVRPHMLLGEIIAEMLEAESALQRQSPERPAILSVQTGHEVELFIDRV